MFILMASTQQILGIRFFNGDVEEAVALMCEQGGFLVAPSGTCFSRLRHDTAYRQAVTRADLAIPDSGAMVLLWKILRGQKIARISGLKYLQRLLATLKGEGEGKPIPEPVFHHFQVVVGLQIQPKSLCCAEIPGQPQGRVG